MQMMSRVSASMAVLVAATLVSPLVAGEKISRELEARLTTESDVKVIVFFKNAEQARSGKESQEQVLRRLQRNLAATRRVFREQMGFVNARTVRSENWISNSISFSASKEIVARLEQNASVERIIWDAPVSPAERLAPTNNRPEADEFTFGLRNLKIPQVREVYGFTGAGVRVGNIDTGADGNHPDLQGKIVQYKDLSGATTTPTDEDGHGTHTAATMVGGNKSGTHIGVAPDAQLLVARGIAGDSVLTNLLNAMQWMLDPDANPATADAPVVVSMSWHTGGGDQAAFYEAVQAMHDAGVVPNFSAGNSGTSGLTHPKEHPRTLTSAAVDEAQNIADFSSRGPANYNGQVQNKPEIASPGVDVYSAQPGGGYQKMSGTSMAAPHTAGVIALLFQANPGLTPDQVKEVLQQTAIDKGTAGWDGSYGSGHIDALAAVAMVAEGGDLAGSVKNAAGEPVKAAKVRVVEREYNLSVKPDGTFKVRLPEGTYTVETSAFGYLTGSAQVTVVKDQVVQLDTVLQAAESFAVHGSVAGNGAAVGGAKISVVGAPVEAVNSDDEGHFHLNLPQGTYTLQVSAFRFQVTTKEITVPGDEVSIELAPLPPVLLVDDDAGKGYESFFKAALTAAGKEFGVLDHKNSEIDADTLTPYETVVWFTGDDYGDTLSANDQARLTAYLAAGGKLIISSAELGYHLKGSDFYKNTLKAEFTNDSSDNKNVSGLGLTFKIEGGDGANNQRYPDTIKPRAGAEQIFAYGNSQGAGIKVGSNIVYVSFGLEGVDTAANRAALIGKLFAALGGSAEATATDTVTPAKRGVTRQAAFEQLFD